MIPDSVAYRAYTLAQALAPFDTGNLKFNAMHLLIVSNGFDIQYDSNFAYYLKWVEEGIAGGGNSNKNKFFIKHETRSAVAGYIQTALNGNIAIPTRYHKLVTDQSGRELERRSYREANSIIEQSYKNRYF